MCIRDRQKHILISTCPCNASVTVGSPIDASLLRVLTQYLSKAFDVILLVLKIWVEYLRRYFWYPNAEYSRYVSILLEYTKVHILLNPPLHCFNHRWIFHRGVRCAARSVAHFDKTYWTTWSWWVKPRTGTDTYRTAVARYEMCESWELKGAVGEGERRLVGSCAYTNLSFLWTLTIRSYSL